MKIEDYESKLNGMVGNPDTAPATAAELMEAIRGDMGALDAANASIAEKDALIDQLRADNNALFARIPHAEDVPEEEPEEPATLADMFDDKEDN